MTPVVAVNAFYLCGGALAAWALLVAFLGITREGFPGSRGGARAVMAISVLLAAAAVGSAVITSATEEHEQGEGEESAEPAP